MADDKEDGAQPECFSLTNLILYKMDRTLAIVGLAVIGIWAMHGKISPDAGKVVMGVVGALAVYVGGRSK